MSVSKDASSPINRAHALSAKASQTAQISPSSDNLTRAAVLYDQAADLFDKVKKETTDAGAAATLTLLAAQNRKKAKDTARRAALTRTPKAASEGSTREGDSLIPDRHRRRRPGGSVEGAMPVTAPAHSLTPALPFARPIPPSAAPIPPPSLGPSISFLPSSTKARSETKVIPPSKENENTSGHRSGPGSVMYASSSSSEQGGGDSFVKFGHPLESSDPFARFWAVLETAFDQISNPVAFAAAPLDIQRVGKKQKDKGRDDNLSIEPISPSSADSFEVVPKKIVGAKTPEELALENEHLRASLDALSKHNMQVEQELKRVKDREGMMKSVVLGVKMEAQKVMQSQELLRSQMPGSRMFTTSAIPRPTDPLQRRVVDLEEQVKFLQAENERARSHLQKYRDRFERIKTSARAKKEAKLLAAGGPLATLGEEEGEGA